MKMYINPDGTLLCAEKWDGESSTFDSFDPLVNSAYEFDTNGSDQLLVINPKNSQTRYTIDIDDYLVKRADGKIIKCTQGELDNCIPAFLADR